MSPAAADVQRILVLTGATAAGKKEIGLGAARRLDVDVISMDSVKVFRGLMIGAARPSPEQVAGLRVYVTQVVEPTETYSVGRYLADAAAAVADIRARGRVPMFLGGTPLYLQGLLRGLFAGPPANPEIRARLQEEVDRNGVEALHRRLSEFDPVAAGRILPGDFKRISRALEVFALTGRPISELQRTHTHQPIEGNFHVVGLRCESGLAAQRQEQRVDQMLERGLVAEVRDLAARQQLTGEAAKAIGYREVMEHLAGRLTAEEVRHEILRSTRRLARKQQKWFRRFPEIEWVDRNPEHAPGELIDTVAARFRRGPLASLRAAP